MKIFFSWIFIATPWLAGGMLGIYVGRKNNLNGGEKLLIFAAGSFFWLVAQGVLIWIASVTGLASAQSIIVASIMASAVMSCYIYFKLRGFVSTIALNILLRAWRQPLALFLGTEFLLMLTLVTWMPGQGWDFLWYKADVGLFLLDPQGPQSVTPWVKFMVHPPIPEALAVSSAWSSSKFSHYGPHLSYWLLIWLSITFAVSGYSYSATGSSTFALMMAFVTMSVPLLENHIALAGYAEPFVASGLAISVASLANYIRHKLKIWLIIGLFAALSIIFLKNIGVLYAVCIVLAFLLIIIAEPVRKTSTRMVISTASAVALLCFVLWLALKKSLVKNGIMIFGRFLDPSHATLSEIAINQSYALIINQTFSVGILFYGLTCVFMIRANDQLMRHEIFLWLCSTLCFFMLTLSQVTAWGYVHATPDNDTGNSRFTLNFIAITIFNLITLIRIASTRSVLETPTAAQRDKLV